MPASTCCRRTPHDLPNHKSEFGKSPIERVGNIDIQHDPSGQPQCALRLSEPVKSSLYPSALRRVKRTHIANQMKRVQGDESPWRSLGRPPLIGAGRVFVIPECPSLRKTHPHRESNEESPGRRVSLAQCGLHLLEPGKSSLYPRGPSPRERHPRRESNEESPESRRLFGAVWGAAAVRLPPFAPAYSPRKT